MPRTIQLHPASLLAGVGLSLVAVVAMGQSPVSNRPQLDHESPYLQVAHPRDWIVIEQGSPYSVPAGKLLVTTGLGSTRTLINQHRAQMKFDGVQVLEVTAHSTGGGQWGFSYSAPSVMPTPVGLRAGPGVSVSVDQEPSSTNARAWGYLVDA